LYLERSKPVAPPGVSTPLSSQGFVKVEKAHGRQLPQGALTPFSSHHRHAVRPWI
jgi:hypothetical protein